MALRRMGEWRYRSTFLKCLFYSLLVGRWLDPRWHPPSLRGRSSLTFHLSRRSVRSYSAALRIQVSLQIGRHICSCMQYFYFNWKEKFKSGTKNWVLHVAQTGKWEVQTQVTGKSEGKKQDRRYRCIVDDRIILKWILKKQSVCEMDSTGLGHCTVPVSSEPSN
jgi:predicted secreted protein